MKWPVLLCLAVIFLAQAPAWATSPGDFHTCDEAHDWLWGHRSELESLIADDKNLTGRIEKAESAMDDLQQIIDNGSGNDDMIAEYNNRLAERRELWQRRVAVRKELRPFASEFNPIAERYNSRCINKENPTW